MNFFEDSDLTCSQLFLTGSDSDLENTKVRPKTDSPTHHASNFTASPCPGLKGLSLMPHIEKEPNVHKRQYGYELRNACDLDALGNRWQAYADKGWLRPFEVKARIKQAAPSTTCMTQSEADYFIKGSRIGFQYIARRHNLRPMQMWNKVAQGLVVMGMHRDDLDDVQELLFGWADLTAEMLERFRWRYPDRCPLLDVLCTMDDTCNELNDVQDWILELKGSKDRRRLDLLPALPDPDGIRPVSRV